MAEEKVFNRWLVVVGGLIVNLQLGVIYSWSIFIKPLMAEFGWTKAQAASPFTVVVFLFGFMMIPAGKLQDIYGPKWVATGGGVLLGLGFILSTWAQSLPYLLFTYGIIGGIGEAAAYVTPVATGIKWFPDKRGLVTGLIVMGFGAGAFFLAPIGTSIILNPALGWRKCFLYFGVLFIIGIPVFSQLLRLPPPGYVPPGWTPPESSAMAKAVKDLEPGQILKTRTFWQVWLAFVFAAQAGLLVIGHLAAFAIESGIDPVRAAFAISMLSILNGLGRPGAGWLSDYLGRPTTMGLMFGIQAIMMAILFKMGGSIATLYPTVMIIGFCYGANFSLFPSATADFFGPKNIGVNYGLVFCSWGVAGVVGPQVAGFVFDVTGRYLESFYMGSALCIIAAILAYTAKVPKEAL